MCIGIMLDAYTGDHWYRIKKDVDSVKMAMQSIKLPLPIAAIFDSLKNDLVELNVDYGDQRSEILDKARKIYNEYRLQHPGEPRLSFKYINSGRRIKESQ